MLLNKQTPIVPSDTSNEHMQRIEEWTQNSTSAPPSNKKRTAKEQENYELEVKSQLIVEAVQLLDHRDKQTSARNGKIDDVNDDLSDKEYTDREPQNESMGKDFRNSNMSAKLYVKHFENRIKRKKEYAQAIASTYPSIRSRKNLLKGSTLIDANIARRSSTEPVVEPDSWRYKASRSVKFAVKSKSGSQQGLSDQKQVDEASEDGEKWIKKENDADWWRWKLKQRFRQNDELLNKLASQRQKPDGLNFRRDMEKITRKSLGKSENSLSNEFEKNTLTSLPLGRNSSWHVTVEIPSHMASSLSNSKRLAESMNGTSQLKARDPMPNFYVPSKQLVSAMKTQIPFKEELPGDAEVTVEQKLKTLKKDPYLSKLLAGNEIFKPEMMLDTDPQQKKHQLSQDYTSGTNPRRKLSLESLTDTDDDATAANFFNPDVKVLYERLSEMELLNNNDLEKNKPLGVSSREPSDGFLNLSLLLETGRFSRYNKLPSMKLLGTYDALSKQQAKKSEKLHSSKKRSRNNGGSYLTNLKLTGKPPVAIVGANVTIATESNSPSANVNMPDKIEDLPTREWAKKIMSKVKKYDTATKTDDEGKLHNNGNISRKDEINDILNIQQGKYKVPIDQETNLLYHEILMSKWKKDKHIKEKDNDAGGRNKHNSSNAYGTREEHGHEGNKTSKAIRRPKGLDIWLENIRERAKRDRVITPLKNNTDN